MAESAEFAEFAESRPSHSGDEWLILTRPAAAADLGALAPLYAERENVDLSVAADRIRGWLAGTDRFVFVAERGSTVVGYATATRLDPPQNGGTAPAGWYLTGVVVAPEFRRHGVGRRLTQVRLREISKQADEVWYFANQKNAASVALHEEFGFREVTRDFTVPGVEFSGSGGVLFRAPLARTTAQTDPA